MEPLDGNEDDVNRLIMAGLCSFNKRHKAGQIWYSKHKIQSLSKPKTVKVNRHEAKSPVKTGTFTVIRF